MDFKQNIPALWNIKMPFINAHCSVLRVHFQTISMYKAFFNANKLKSGVCLSKSFLRLYVLVYGCHGKPFFTESQDTKQLNIFK